MFRELWPCGKKANQSLGSWGRWILFTSKPFLFHPNPTGTTVSLSGALFFHFDCTLILPRIRFDVTCESLRFQFRVKSSYIGFNSGLTLLSLQIRVTCTVSNSLEIRFVSNLSIQLRFHFAFVFTWSSHRFRLVPLDTTSLCVVLSLLRIPRLWCAPTSPNWPLHSWARFSTHIIVMSIRWKDIWFPEDWNQKRRI